MMGLLIHIANGLWLGLLFVGVPAAARMKLGWWDVGSAQQAHRVIFWGLVAGFAGNLLAAYLRVGSNSYRFLWRRWALGHALLGSVVWLILKGHLRFGWLRSFLVWLGDRLG